MIDNKDMLTRNSTFLITGGAGFIGSNIVEVLVKQGFKVKVLDNFSTGKRENIKEFLDNPNVHLIEGDIRNLKTCLLACKGVDFVLHQAALGSVSRSIDDPKTTSEVNIMGTVNMLIAAKENNVKRFIYASSSSVYGDEITLPKEESKIGNPLSPYAITKLTNELYAQNFYKLYGLPTIGLRYFNVYGKKQNQFSKYSAVIPEFVQKIINHKQPIIFGDGKQSRDFTYIDDIVQVNFKACLAKEDAFGEVFNVSYGDTITVTELYMKIRDLLEANIDPIYGLSRLGDVKHSLANINKAKEILGYSPMYNIDKGLYETINWYLSQMSNC